MATERLALGERGLVVAHLGMLLLLLLLLELVGQYLLVVAVGVDPVMNLLHSRHNFISHVEPKLAHLLLFHKLPVLPLSLPGSSTNPIPPRSFFWRQLLACKLRWRLWWLLVRVYLHLLLLLLLLLLSMVTRRRKSHDAHAGSVAISFALATLPLSCLLALQSLAWSFIVARPFTRCAGRIIAVHTVIHECKCIISPLKTRHQSAIALWALCDAWCDLRDVFRRVFSDNIVTGSDGRFRRNCHKAQQW